MPSASQNLPVVKQSDIDQAREKRLLSIQASIERSLAETQEVPSPSTPVEVDVDLDEPDDAGASTPGVSGVSTPGASGDLGQLQPPPGASASIHKMAKRVQGPVEHFLHLETSGGVVLLVAAAVALVWANSSLAHSYHALWDTPFVFSIGSLSGSVNLHFIINDCLMAIFFLLVGMEIKREIVEGELSELKKAALPLAAAAGGMMVPAIIYFAFNPAAESTSGWGVPMATDIAFAVGVLSLLGKRVPAAMKILLLALAIVDDLGAILVIAFFYTADFQVAGLFIAGAGIGMLVLWRNLGVRPGPLFLAPMAVIWAGLFVAGIHPTLAGVIVGLATPVRPWLSKAQFISAAKQTIADFEHASGKDAEAGQVAAISRLNFASREALSPVARGVKQMHIWIAFAVMPLFALANAGVDLGGVDFGHPAALKVMLGVSLGLALGKPLGVMLISWLLVKSGKASLPKGLDWTSILVIGLIAGIGFTMAIFIAELAFAGQPSLLALAKLAILVGTAVAAIVGLSVGFWLLKPVSPEIAALTPSDVEKSAEY